MEKNIIQNGTAYGSVAKRLMAAKFNTNALRTNATLRKDEWKQILDAVTDVAVDRLRIVGSLVDAGLEIPLANAMGSTQLEFEKVSDMSDAETSMSPTTRGERDRPTYDIGSIPLPIVHKEFHLDARTLEASRTRGTPLSITGPRVMTRKVTEGIEDLFIGKSTFKFAGSDLYGLLNHPQRNTKTDLNDWSDKTNTSGEDILDDVLEMIDLAQADKYFGPYNLYVPTNYGARLEDDFKANSDRTIRERLMAIEVINDIVTVDRMTADNVALVDLTPETIQVVNGLEPQPIEWDERGGMELYFMIIAIMVPLIQADSNNNSGIVHATTA